MSQGYISPNGVGIVNFTFETYEGMDRLKKILRTRTNTYTPAD